MTEIVLDKIDPASLEGKIVKTLSLIYILEQFEKLQPSREELINVFSISYTRDEINKAIENLIEKEYVVYLKRSNNYLRLKQTSGVDIRKKINDKIEIQRKQITIKETLNQSNFDNYIYPSRYNNDKDMIRYFSFEFIDEEEVFDEVNWEVKSESIDADGVVYGIIPHSEDSIGRLKKILLRTSRKCNRFVFILPKHYTEIEDIVREFNAASVLREEAHDDKVLYEEYEVIYEDLRDVINSYMRGLSDKINKAITEFDKISERPNHIELALKKYNRFQASFLLEIDNIRMSHQMSTEQVQYGLLSEPEKRVFEMSFIVAKIQYKLLAACILEQNNGGDEDNSDTVIDTANTIYQTIKRDTFKMSGDDDLEVVNIVWKENANAALVAGFVTSIICLIIMITQLKSKSLIGFVGVCGAAIAFPRFFFLKDLSNNKLYKWRCIRIVVAILVVVVTEIIGLVV